MNYLKKTIFLSNDEKSKGMATLTLESKNKSIFGTIKMYSNYRGQYILGIKCKDKIIKQNINLESSSYSFLLDKIDMAESLSCVILDTTNNAIPILWGSERKENYKSQIIQSLKNSIMKISNSLQAKYCNTKSNTSSTMKGNNTFQYNNEMQTNEQPERGSAETSSEHCEDNEIGKIYDSIEDFSPNTDNEEYSQISLEEETINHQEEIAVACTSSTDLFSSTEEEIDSVIDKEINSYPKGKHRFYDMIAEQLDELFLKYPREENLCKLIENSDWVKIDTEIDNKHHVVGIISDNNDIRYICYGVPGSYNNEPPAEMRNYSQWLPTDTLDPYNNGYWVMYQDVDTGENVLMN